MANNLWTINYDYVRSSFEYFYENDQLLALGKKVTSISRVFWRLPSLSNLRMGMVHRFLYFYQESYE